MKSQSTLIHTYIHTIQNVHTNFKTMSDKKGEEKQDVLCKQNKDDQKLEAGKIHENGVNDD